MKQDHLFTNKPIIDGQDVETSDTFSAVSPSTGRAFETVYRSGKAEIDAAVASSQKAFESWSRRPVKDREKFLLKLLNIVREMNEPLAELIAREQGKPIAEARAVDIVPAADTLRYLSRKTEELLRPRPVEYEQILFAHKTGSFRFDPLGVIAVVTPWNYPFGIPFVEVAACLAAGNTVVLKPASATALTGIAIGDMCRWAGLPPGVVNVVTPTGADVNHLIEHPAIAKILFTGSVETGMHVMQRAARNLTGVVLELGGKDPAIICEDADLERTATGVVWGAFVNAGQSCGAIERVYVLSKVAKKFTELVVQRTQEIRVGDPLNESTDLGPMTTAGQRLVVEEQVKDAIEKGAKVLCGGRRPKAKGYWYPPTVLSDVDHTMRCMTEETFGPLLPIQVVESLDEAIALANDSEYGLTASGWTRSKRIAQRLAEELQAGTVTINDHLFSFGEPTATWGGIKKSGIGRSHSVYGLMELVNVKHVSVDLGDSPSMPWWYPYNESFHEFTKRAFGALYATDPKEKLAEALGLVGSGRFFGYVKVSDIATKLGKMF
ncbi:MAG: aldehyde dehydrogenase [Acidobacteria bacterium]|nr:aldehyde dehydrogenase [Acidobacteriota bacterium]MCG3194338.1 Succinate-semialdehyde dehydrogenase [NADP(+)] GabD [Thermoanaerobaculia bacterium]